MAVFDPIAEGDRSRYEWIGTAILFFLISLPITFISRTVIERMGLTLEHFIPLFEHPLIRVSIALIGGLVVWGNIREKKDTNIYVVSKRKYSAAEIDNIVRDAVIAETLAQVKQNTFQQESTPHEYLSISEVTPERLQHTVGWTPDQEYGDSEKRDEPDDTDDDEWEDPWEEDEDCDTHSSAPAAPSQPVRLSLELVPRSCWFSNLRSALGPERWKPIARAVSKSANHRCDICGGRGPKWPVEAHETWDYDDARGIQRLSIIRALCPSCHEVKHFGLASINGRKEIAFNHLKKINQWSDIPAQDYVRHEFQVWRERSEKSWTLNLSELSRYGFSENEIRQLENSETSRRNTVKKGIA